MSDKFSEISSRLDKMKEALKETDGIDKPSCVVYCTKCDDYAVGRRNHLPCDFLSDESEEDHNSDYHVVADYESTSLLGYVMALEWVEEVLDDS